MVLALMPDIPPLDVVVVETYALHTIVTNVGIEPSDVIVTCGYVANLDPPGECAVMLIRRGWLSCNVPVARLNRRDGPRFLEAWRAFAHGKKALSKDALDRLLYESDAWKARVDVLCALAAKGFHLTPGIPS